MDFKLRKGWLGPLVHLTHNAVSFVGIFLVNIAAVFWLFVLPVYIREGASHPYLSLFFIVALPAAFAGGVVLTPLGMYLRYRRETRRGTYPQTFRSLGWENREFRNLSVFAVLVTGVNVLVGGYYSNAAVKYMDSPNFCGGTCHSMYPEYSAYQNSPHVNIGCVACHIGSGSKAKVQAKLNGIKQMVGTVLDNHSRPIPTPVHNLRPAREICETCHWPKRFAGFKLHVLDKFAEDELNTHTKTVLVVRVGGNDVTDGVHGSHAAPGVTIEYASDPSRQNIPWVRYTDSTGQTTEYATADWDVEGSAQLQRREMDCMDCHTRPAHRFQVPGRALDEALAANRVDSTLPWAKRQGLDILRSEYATTEDAEAQIPASLQEFYRAEYPELHQTRRGDIDRSGLELLSIYKRNVFPDMNITWRTYPDNLGHTDFMGCFRCHFGNHKTDDGTTITTTCTACHQILARDESEPDVLRRFGIQR
jgi:nitrate/TMAO reductase-like tetraheme cytochrome c subunit